MEKILSYCPTCKEPLAVKSLYCPQCSLELTNSFSLSPFDYLGDDDMEYLLCFLRCRGNLKIVQSSLGISYPTAKKRLEHLLLTLNLTDKDEVDMTHFEKTTNSSASAIIRNKLIESGGKATIYTLDGTPREILLTKDGHAFTCEALSKESYTFNIFDCIVDLLIQEGGRAAKGQARGKADKVGSPKCNAHTVTGVIAIKYYGKQEGESVFDPVFILAGILEWANIAKNRRGYIELIDPCR